MPHILLVAINAKWIHPALSLRLLKANLGRYESQAEILELALRQPVTEQADLIIGSRPRILGVSVSIWNHKATAELLQTLDTAWRKGAAPKPAVILGGPEASHLPAETDIFRYADWIIQGEGEQAFRELCRSLLDGLPAPPLKITAAPQTELAELEPGYRLYTDEDLQRKLIYVEASRGCPFGCEFCLSSRSGLREFPLDSFLKEMDILIRRGAKAFKFLDRSFNLNIPRARRILEFFLERLVPPQYVHFEMIPSRFPQELRQTVSAFPPGTLRLELGIQTFNPVTAELIGRQSDPEKELEVLRFLSEKTNAIVHTDLIAGLPAEDSASFAAGFDRLWQAGPTEIQIGILKCLPGTPLNRHTASQQMRYAPEPPYEVSETGALPQSELDRIKNFARFWEIIVNRGAFAGFSDALFPRKQGVFSRFMDISDRLLRRFGKNWGIPQQDLRKALESG